MSDLDRLRAVAENGRDAYDLMLNIGQGIGALLKDDRDAIGAYDETFGLPDADVVLALLDVAEDVATLLDEHDRIESDPDAEMDWRTPLTDGPIRHHLDRLREVTS